MTRKLCFTLFFIIGLFFIPGKAQDESCPAYPKAASNSVSSFIVGSIVGVEKLVDGMTKFTLGLTIKSLNEGIKLVHKGEDFVMKFAVKADQSSMGFLYSALDKVHALINGIGSFTGKLIQPIVNFENSIQDYFYGMFSGIWNMIKSGKLSGKFNQYFGGILHVFKSVVDPGDVIEKLGAKVGMNLTLPAIGHSIAKLTYKLEEMGSAPFVAFKYFCMQEMNVFSMYMHLFYQHFQNFVFNIQKQNYGQIVDNLTKSPITLTIELTHMIGALFRPYWDASIGGLKGLIGVYGAQGGIGGFISYSLDVPDKIWMSLKKFSKTVYDASIGNPVYPPPTGFTAFVVSIVKIPGKFIAGLSDSFHQFIDSLSGAGGIGGIFKSAIDMVKNAIHSITAIFTENGGFQQFIHYIGKIPSKISGFLSKTLKPLFGNGISGFFNAIFNAPYKAWNFMKNEVGKINVFITGNPADMNAGFSGLLKISLQSPVKALGAIFNASMDFFHSFFGWIGGFINAILETRIIFKVKTHWSGGWRAVGGAGGGGSGGGSGASAGGSFTFGGK